MPDIRPSKKYIQDMLTRGLVHSDQDRNQHYYPDLQNVSSQEVKKIICGETRGIRSVFIRLAFKCRKLIIRIPVLGKIARKAKEKMLNNAVNRMNEQPGILDLSSIMGLRGDNFIKALYRTALGRDPDSEGFDSFRRLQAMGANNEALAYVICIAAEYGNRASVLHFDKYKKEFLRYKRKYRLKQIPLLYWVWYVITWPKRAAHNRVESYIRNAQVLHQLERVEQKLDIKTEQLAREQMERIELRFIALSKLITISNEKSDMLAGLMINLANKGKTAFSVNPGGVTVIQVSDFIMGVPSEEWRLAMFLSLYGHFEPGTEKFFNTLLRKNMNVVDVGANLGIYTLHAGRAGCTVFSYEPTPTTFKLLQQNIAVNGFEAMGIIHPYNLAVAECEKEVVFTVCEGICGHNNMFESPDDKHNITVKAVALDNNLNEVQSIDVVKIDVEGAEPLVLRGMKDIIIRNPDIKIIMEFSPGNLIRAGVVPKDFIYEIRNGGLDIAWIDEETGTLTYRNDEDLMSVYSVNLFLARPNIMRSIVQET